MNGMMVMYGGAPMPDMSPRPAEVPDWARRSTYEFPVDPPPPHADVEAAAIAAVAALPEAARRRVMRYLASRFGKAGR